MAADRGPGDVVAPPAFRVESDDAHVRVSWDGHEVEVETLKKGGPYEWQRRIAILPTHVEVQDTVTGRGRDVSGLRLEYTIAAAGDVRLGGQRVAGRTEIYDPWNPTVFTPVGTAGVGLVAEDDVLRQQLLVRFDPSKGRASLATDMLCLAAGDSYTVRWSVYPGATGRYWDFVNTVRRDWGVDRTVPGSYVWFTPDHVLSLKDDALRAALARQGTTIASLAGGWVDPTRTARPTVIGFGSYVRDAAFADYRARVGAAIAKLKRVRPGLKTLVYFDTQRDSAPDAPTRYPDSLLRLPGGDPEWVDWKGRFSRAWSMVPTVENSFGRTMQDVAHAMRELGADGLYWDEIDAVNFRAPRITETPWDRRSCVLASDGAVKRKVGMANLLSDDVKRRYDGEGFVLGNGPASTASWRRTDEVRMIEAFHAPSWTTFAHLSTPLGYIGFTDRSWAAVLRTVDAGLLVAGGRLDYDYDVFARMFPFTPRYIEAGTLWGEERVLTTRSGPLVWRTTCRDVRAFRYDAVGKEHPAAWPISRDASTVRLDVRLGSAEMALLECTNAPGSR